ncbi:unnamed protein product [Chrysoparadoxa australica]
MATYGEGEPTDNARPFLDWMKDEADGALSGLQFTVFGLGNKQYEHYNRMGTLTDKELTRLGATHMFEYGEGDDDANLEDDFDEWKDRLWAALTEMFGGGEGDEMQEVGLQLPFTLDWVGDNDKTPHTTKESEAVTSARYFWQAQSVRVICNRELRTPADGGSTRHIEVSLEGTSLSYETADNMSVLPQNKEAIVTALAQRMGYDLEAVFHLDLNSGEKAPFPTPCTVREALTRYVDLSGVPRRGVVEHLAGHATDAGEREQIKRLSSKEGMAEFKARIIQQSTTVHEVLLDMFPSIRIPLAMLLHILPHLRPREYTIASSSLVHPTAVHLTVAVVEKQHQVGRVVKGTCSGYLEEVKEQDMLKVLSTVLALLWPLHQVLIKPSSFRLPKDPETPILLIGPGTGIAPMRALLQERKHMGQGGVNVLYFGCRHSEKDYLYKEEMQEMVEEGTVTKLHTAFSREGKTKVYVQHRLKEAGQESWKLLNSEGAYLYVCGGTAMGADVAKALSTIACDEGGMSEVEAKAFLQELHSKGRYVQELWS